jgi:hypothetical protein
MAELMDWTLEYDKLSRGFSPWIPWRGLSAYEFMNHPGVYLLAEIADDSAPPSIVDPGIIYIGETTKQSLLTRFIQFEEAARTGCDNRHCGGKKYSLRANGELIGLDNRLLPDEFHISVMPISMDEPLSSAFIKYTERAAIWYYVRENNRYPRCNTA